MLPALLAIRMCVALLAVSAKGGPVTVYVPRTGENPDHIVSLQARAQSFEQVLDSLRLKHRLPGLSVAIVAGQHIVYEKGFGFADIARQQPATPNTPYEIASLTKIFTSVLALQLAEEGVLNLDSTLHGQYPDYADFCQRAQNSRSPYLRNYCCAPECQNTLRCHLSHTALGSKPGTWFMYNGLLYGLARRLLEHQTGQPFAALLHERIFWQAGMESTLAGAADYAENPQVFRAVAKPYKWHTHQRRHVEQPGQHWGAGASAGLISTAHDLALFDIALNRSRLITARTRAIAWQPQTTPAGDTLVYGLGWFVQPNSASGPSPRLAWHYGWLLNGYSALYLKLPDHNLTLILLSNGEGLAAPFGLINGDVRKSPFASEFLRLFLEVPL